MICWTVQKVLVYGVPNAQFLNRQTDRQTDGQVDGQDEYIFASSLLGGGIIKELTQFEYILRPKKTLLFLVAGRISF